MVNRHKKIATEKTIKKLVSKLMQNLYGGGSLRDWYQNPLDILGEITLKAELEPDFKDRVYQLGAEILANAYHEEMIYDLYGQFIPYGEELKKECEALKNSQTAEEIIDPSNFMCNIFEEEPFI